MISKQDLSLSSRPSGPPLPQLSFFLTVSSVRKSTENRQERSSVTVTVRDKPSAEKRHGKSSFPDGKPSLTAETVRKDIQRWFSVYRQGRFPLTAEKRQGYF